MAVQRSLIFAFITVFLPLFHHIHPSSYPTFLHSLLTYLNQILAAFLFIFFIIDPEFFSLGFLIILFFKLFIFFFLIGKVDTPYVTRDDINLDDAFERLHYWWDKGERERVPVYDKYLTFIPWRAGLNNRRMSFELALTFAFLLNRTLVRFCSILDHSHSFEVLPSSFRVYPFDQHSYSDFFDINVLAEGYSLINMDEFKKRTGITELKDDGGIQVTELNWEEFNRQQSVFVYPYKPNATISPEEYQVKLSRFFFFDSYLENGTIFWCYSCDSS